MAVSNIDEQIECVKREIKQRARVYPRWVEQAKMTQDLADRETQRMTDVLATLEALRPLLVHWGSSEYILNSGFEFPVINAAPLPPQGSLL